MSRKQQIWDYQDTDTPKSWEAFQIYRDMGTNRSLVKLGQTIGKNSKWLAQWSSKHEWMKRIEAYVKYLASEKSRADEQEREDERKQRREIVRFQTQLIKEEGGKLSAKEKDKRTPSDVRAFLHNAESALEQSRKEYNDLPTKRTELVDERLLKSVLDAIKSMGQEPADIFNEIIAMAKEHDS